jgi:hypothetical protein
MKLNKIVAGTTLFIAMVCLAPAQANQTSVLGSYKGGGYTVEIESDGDYHGCDPQNRCVIISHKKSSRKGKTRIWRNAGYTYQITAIGETLEDGHNTRIALKIISPKKRVVFDRVLRSQ